MKKDFRSITQIYRDMNKPQITEAVANAATLEYGTTIARDEYAKDTPGQAPGDAPHQPEHARKAKFGLSVDGIPKKGGEMVKPDNNVTTGLKVEGHDSEPELVDEKKKLDPVGQADADIDNDGDVDSSDKYLHKRRKAIKKAITKEAKDDMCSCDCDCGKKICESCGKPKAAEDVKEGLGDMIKKGVDKVKKVRNDIKNFHKTDTAAAIRKDGMLIRRQAKEGFQVPEYSVFAEAMSVTLRPSKSQPGSYKVHSVGSKMKAHGGIKPGERVKDSHIDDLHDSGIKVKYHKEDTDLDEAGRWDDTTTGRRYRSMSPEEKKRVARTNALKKKAKAVYKGRGDLDKVSEAMSPLERKQAAAKIFKMHQAKKGNAQKAKAAAMRDSSSYKTSDDSHLDAKPSPKPKGKKGVSDTPHIVGQLRGVVDTKGNHKGVQFKDGSTHKVSHDHAKAWLKKHDSAKPHEKLAMYKHHDSPSHFKKAMNEQVLGELSKDTLSSYKDKATKDMPRLHDKMYQPMGKDGKNYKNNLRNLKKRRQGIDTADKKIAKEENVQEISNELVKKVAHQRNVNVSVAGSKADYDRRDPDYQKAAEKQHKNKMLRFSRGAAAIKKARTANEGYTDKEIRMAKGIAFDKRHVGGDYTGAAKKMEKIKKGLSDHPKAKDALRRANEQRDFAKSLFQQEAIERRADRKTIIATDPATGRKVVKMAPKKEIEIGKGKMA